MEIWDYRWVPGQPITEWLFCVLFCFFLQKGSWYVVQDGLEFIAILLFHTFKCWDYCHSWLWKVLLKTQAVLQGRVRTLNWTLRHLLGLRSWFYFLTIFKLTIYLGKDTWLRPTFCDTSVRSLSPCSQACLSALRVALFLLTLVLKACIKIATTHNSALKILKLILYQHPEPRPHNVVPIIHSQWAPLQYNMCPVPYLLQQSQHLLTFPKQFCSLGTRLLSIWTYGAVLIQTTTATNSIIPEHEWVYI